MRRERRAVQASRIVLQKLPQGPQRRAGNRQHQSGDERERGRLPPGQFVRISRSAIVNIDRVKELQPLFHGEYAVILRDNTRLTLSRSYREKLDTPLGRQNG